MARRARCWRVRSVFTPQGSASQAAKVNTHAALVKVGSGQLLFLGLFVRGTQLICPMADNRQE